MTSPIYITGPDSDGLLWICTNAGGLQGAVSVRADSIAGRAFAASRSSSGLRESGEDPASRTATPDTLPFPDDAGPHCDACKGRGWLPGDCHPHEVCGTCNGTGYPKSWAAGEIARLDAEIARLRAAARTAPREEWSPLYQNAREVLREMERVAPIWRLDRRLAASVDRWIEMLKPASPAATGIGGVAREGLPRDPADVPPPHETQEGGTSAPPAARTETPDPGPLAVAVKALDAVARAADTAELLLKKTCPAEAQHLRSKVTDAIAALRSLSFSTTEGSKNA